MLMTVLALAASLQAPAAEPLAPLSFLVGHCWQAEFPNGARDTHCFEPVYGGRFIRDRHEVTGGYAGETLYAWDAAANAVTYTYWSNRGGLSRGTMRAQGGLLDFGDEVHRGTDGRETRIATRWRQVDADSYEVTTSSDALPTGARVTVYRRLARDAVAIDEARAADGSATLSHETVVAAAPEQVYAALASAEGWRSWAVPHAWPVVDDPDMIETSYAPDARYGNPANIRQRFLARVPNRLIVFRTVQFPPGFRDAEAFARTTSIVELEPVAGGTRVRLTGAGYPAGEAGDRVRAFFREGNRASLEALRRRFAAAGN
jgi:uncharacterized protein YndB with AHSA1/START domain